MVLTMEVRKQFASSVVKAHCWLIFTWHLDPWILFTRASLLLGQLFTACTGARVVLPHMQGFALLAEGDVESSQHFCCPCPPASQDYTELKHTNQHQPFPSVCRLAKGVLGAITEVVMNMLNKTGPMPTPKVLRLQLAIKPPPISPDKPCDAAQSALPAHSAAAWDHRCQKPH